MMQQYSVAKNVEIINAIIGIEAGAQEMMENAEREKEGLPKKIAEILEEYRASQQKFASETIESVRLEQESAAKRKTEQIFGEFGQKLEKLKKITDEHMALWVDEIYAYIVAPTEF